MRSAFFLWLAVGVALSPLAHGHSLPIERSLMIAVHADRVEVLGIYAEAPGLRTDRLLAMYDLDRDGRLDGRELPLAAPEIATRAFLGIHVELDGTTPPVSPEIKCKRESNRGLSCAVYARIDTREATQRLRVSLDARSGVTPTLVRVSAGDRMMRQTLIVDGRPNEAADVVELRPGDHLDAEFRVVRLANGSNVK